MIAKYISPPKDIAMKYYWRIPIISKTIYAIWKIDAQRKYDWVKHGIKAGDHLLEIGSGPGSILDIFRSHGHHVTGLDIADNSYRDDLKSDIYDGVTMPYPDQSFDCALLLTMLHHTPDPDAILREAMRVSKRLIIIEDVYHTPFQAAYTKFTDSITNLEFIGHPHSNRTDAQWLAAIKALGLSVKHHKIYRLAKIYQQAVYIVE